MSDLSGIYGFICERANKKLANNLTSFQVIIGGKRVAINCGNEVGADTMKHFFLGRLASDDGEPDSEMNIYQDDLDLYMPVAHSDKPLTFESRDGDIFIRLAEGMYLFSYSEKERIFYYCVPKNNIYDTGHPLVVTLFKWAYLSDLFMIHSACVGVDGNGVLISNVGGTGKSTLSVTCLLEGMDFVSDDYTLISGSGDFKAFPIYSMVSMNRDIYDKLNPQMPVIDSMAGNGGKLLLDASEYRYADMLNIKAIICPRITGENCVRITPVNEGKAYTRIITSTVRQAGFNKDTDAIKKMALRLKGLRVYEIELTTDLKKNAKCLKEFIKTL